MGALPRPDLPLGPHRDLIDALHDLHHQAGWPSLRTLAHHAGCSHTTVSTIFSAPKLPAWGTFELIVEAMNGDPDHFHQLWLTASQPPEPETAPPARIAGRKSELTAVRRHLASGGGLLLVTGEAGIGKTTLVQAAVDHADVFVAVGRCLPLSTEVPLMPIVDILRALHDVDEGAWVEDALAGSPPFARDSLARLLPELRGDPAHLRADDEFARYHLFAAVGRVLSKLHERRALSLVVEDVHWADSDSLDLLEHILAGAPAPPILLTWRSDDPAVSPEHSAWLARMQRLSATSGVALGQLTLAQTVEQLSLLWGIPVTADRARPIHERSRGHPLFTEQLAAELDDDQQLPLRLQEILDRSIDGLGEASNTIARTLGVADRGLPYPVLTEVTGLEHSKLLAALHELADRRLLTVGILEEAELRHPLLAEAVRRRLVPGEAASEHRKLAVALASRPNADAAEVAEHWRRADDRDEELTWQALAAQQAHDRTAPGAEADHWLRALEICAAGSSTEADLDGVTARLAAFDALELAGRLEEAHAVVAEAVADVDDLDDMTAAEVLRRIAMTVDFLEQDSRRALTMTDSAINRLESHGASECLVHALDLRANELIDQGRFDEAGEALERALAVCDELDDVDLFFGASATLAWHMAHLGDLDGALRCVHEARARLGGTTDPRREAYMAMMHTDLLIQHRRPAEEVVEAGRRALAIGSEWDMDFHLLTLVRMNVVEALLNLGSTRRASEVLARILPVSDDYAHWPVKWMSAVIAVMEGRLQEAVELMESAQVGPVPQNRVTKSAWLAIAHLWTGEPGRAWEVLMPALEADLNSPTMMDAGVPFMTAARAVADLAARDSEPCRAPGELAEKLAGVRARAVIDPLGPGPAPITRAAATATWTAELARAGGHDTVEQWALVTTEWEKLRSPHDAAYCRWRAAEVALRDGQGTVAARLLKRAARDAREHIPLLTAIRETTERG